MNASELREWVALFLPDLVPDGQGGDRESVPAGLVADLPAKVKEPSGSRIAMSDQLTDRLRYEVTIRYQPAISTAYRVMWRDRFLDIVLVRNLEERDTWLELTCERREAGAQ